MRCRYLPASFLSSRGARPHDMAYRSRKRRHPGPTRHPSLIQGIFCAPRGPPRTLQSPPQHRGTTAPVKAPLLPLSLRNTNTSPTLFFSVVNPISRSRTDRDHSLTRLTLTLLLNLLLIRDPVATL